LNNSKGTRADQYSGGRALRRAATVVVLIVSSLLNGPPAFASDPDSLGAALAKTLPLIDMRLRYEQVDQTGIAEDANAGTLRARLGAETGRFLDSSLLVEGEAMVRLNRSYRPDNAIAHYTQFPVVADPENYGLNRLALTNTFLPATTVTIGRQRIILDDQRFIGNSGWRQNETTFDALRLVTKPFTTVALDLTFLNKVHRVYGADSRQGTYKGDSYLANVSYQLPVGKLTGFAYLLELDPIAGLTGALDPRRGSTSTYGGRLVGERPVSTIKVGYAAAYAWQKQRGDNPLSFSNDYFLAELNASLAGFRAAIGDEIMQGNGTIGFATPLATLHLFEGWADKFLTTPANGVKDLYGSLGWSRSNILGLSSISATVFYHRFDAEHVSTSYGSEWDLAVNAKWHHFAGLLKYAGYSAARTTPTAIAQDTSKLWVQMEYIW
jgi:Alginate export